MVYGAINEKGIERVVETLVGRHGFAVGLDEGNVGALRRVEIECSGCLRLAQ